MAPMNNPELTRNEEVNQKLMEEALRKETEEALQAEEDALEEERKKKKAAENYVLAAVMEQKKAMEIQAAAEKNPFGFLGRDLSVRLPMLYETGKRMVDTMDRERERKNRLFSLDEGAPETAEIREELKKTKLSEENISTLRVCQAGNKTADILDYLEKLDNSGKMEADVAELLGFQVVTMNEARKDLRNLAGGKTEAVGKKIGDGLKSMLERFRDEKDPMKAVKWVSHIEDILDIYRKQPELLKESKLTEKDLETAKEAGQMGSVIRTGVASIERMKNGLSPEKTSFTVEEQNRFIRDVTNMTVMMEAKGINLLPGKPGVKTTGNTSVKTTGNSAPKKNPKPNENTSAKKTKAPAPRFH